MATSIRTPGSTRDKLQRARSASARLAQLTTVEKNAILLAMAEAIAAHGSSILEANQADLDSSGLAGAMRDRLLLTPERIAAMVAGVREVASLPDPVGETLAEWTRPNGLRIRKVRVPLGVVGVIYESRPNVTVDMRLPGAQDRQRHCFARRQGSGPQQSEIGRDPEPGGGSSRRRDRTAGFEHSRFGARTDQGARAGGCADPSWRCRA